MQQFDRTIRTGETELLWNKLQSYAPYSVRIILAGTPGNGTWKCDICASHKYPRWVTEPAPSPLYPEATLNAISRLKRSSDYLVTQSKLYWQ